MLDSNQNDEWIMLNVGGQLFTTTRTTLCTNEPNSMLARMFSQQRHFRSNDYYLHQNQQPQQPQKNHQNSQNSHDIVDDSNDSKNIDNNNMSIPSIDPINTGCATSTISTIKPSPKDSNGAYLIDRSPKYFEPILNYLRHGKLIIDHNVNVQGVLEEAKFYGIVSLLPILELETEKWFKKRHQDLVQSQLLSGEYNYNDIDGAANCAGYNTGGADGTNLQTNPPLTRRDVIKALMSTVTSSQLRFQGCNLANSNLSKLDLSHINFRYANLRNCNLKGANLSFAIFERADLYQSNLEGAILTGTSLRHANLENSNLRAITVSNDHFSIRMGKYPMGSFEAANLKNTNFEGSRLQGVDMRVAILKGSNLQNCDLSRAILAGADLENCDLSGSDLREANLRNANVKGASFELEVS